MATFFNRGKTRIAQSGWTSLDVRALVLADADTLPAGADDPDLNTVADLLAVSGVTEAVGTGYERLVITQSVVEDDTNDQANLDAQDLAYTDVDAGRWVAVVFYVHDAAGDASSDLISLNNLETPLVTNGGSVTLTVNTAGLIGIG